MSLAKKYARAARNRLLRKFYKTHRLKFKDGDVAFPLTDTHAYKWFVRYAFRKYNWHEPSLTQFMLDLPPEKAVFVDVGAHLGYFSAVFSRRPGTRSFAIELDPRNFSHLDRMMKSVRGVKGTIEALNLGISDSDFTAEMPVMKASPTSSLNRTQTEETKTVPVPVTTLDAFCTARGIAPDVVKVDVEGFEWEVLRGGAETIRTHRPILIVEVHKAELKKKGIPAKKLIRRIRRHGYSVFWYPEHRKEEPDQLIPFEGSRGQRNFDIICTPNP